VSVFLGWKYVRLRIKLGTFQHENLFISLIHPTTTRAVMSVTNSLNYYISQIKI